MPLNALQLNNSTFAELLADTHHTVVHLEMRDLCAVGNDTDDYAHFLRTGVPNPTAPGTRAQGSGSYPASHRATSAWPSPARRCARSCSRTRPPLPSAAARHPKPNTARV